MHERHDVAQIIPKTNSLIINGAAASELRVHVLDINRPQTCDRLQKQADGRWQRTRKQSGRRRILYCHMQSHSVPTGFLHLTHREEQRATRDRLRLFKLLLTGELKGELTLIYVLVFGLGGGLCNQKHIKHREIITAPAGI